MTQSSVLALREDAIPRPPCSPDRIHPNNGDISRLTERQLERAKYRFEIIRPILDAPSPRYPLILKQAARFQKSVSTIYDWLERFEAGGRCLTALCDVQQRRRSLRIDPLFVRCIEKSFESHRRKPKPYSFVMFDVWSCAREAGLKPPCEMTVRTHIERIKQQIGQRRLLEEQFKPKTADRIYGYYGGVMELANFPLGIVQVDHTKIDLNIVDDYDRQYIGRAFISIALDVCTRCVLGFYLSLDPVGTLSTGLCLINAMYPKDEWLAEHGVTNPWFHGVPSALHFDNGKEFWSRGLSLACEKYDIAMLHRPLGQPHYGGHIERFIGTLNCFLHTLSGQTSSNITEKEEYPAEKFASKTLFEAEQLITEFITGQYHERVHKGINRTPRLAWRDGVLGSQPASVNDSRLGAGQRVLSAPAERVLLDFLPIREVTIQRNGVTIDYLVYVGDILSVRKGTKDPKTGRSKRLIVRQDPRCISQVHLLDDETNEYHTLTLRNKERPKESLWTWKAHIRKVKAHAKAEVDEDVIFRSILRTRQIEAEAVARTRTVRRGRRQRLEAQRRKSHEAALVAAAPPQAFLAADLHRVSPYEGQLNEPLAPSSV